MPPITRPIAAGGLAVLMSACSGNVDRMLPDGRHERGFDVGIARSVDTTFNQDAARANVLSRGAVHPDPRVRDFTRQRGCDVGGETGERLNRRARWDTAAGKSPTLGCTGS